MVRNHLWLRGSFKSYSENLEKYKKALASALKKLALEI